MGVKGRIQSRMVEEENEKKYYVDVIAERVTFLSNNKKEKADE
jgi:single-stranded DNA-binding protein